MLIFCLAALLALGAVGYAVWSGARTRATNPVRLEVVPRPVVFEPPPPAAPIAPAPVVAPVSRPKPAPPPKVVTPVQLVQVQPGGWVWNPAWHDQLYWERRWGPHRWDNLDDRKRGRVPWDRKPWHEHHGSYPRVRGPR